MESMVQQADRLAREALARSESKRPNANADGVVSATRDHSQNSVVKSNELAQAYYKTTLNQKRVMELVVSRIDSRRNDNEFQNLKITSKMFNDVYGVGIKKAFQSMHSGASGLCKTLIQFGEDEAGTDDTFTFLARVRGNANQGFILCTVAPWAIPHLTMMHEKYTKYTLKYGAELSVNSWRIFELLVSWTNKKPPLNDTKKIQVDELRKVLSVPKSYPFSMFKRRFLVAAQVELKQKLNINLNIEYIKTGRKVTDLKIKYSEDEQQKLPLEGGSTKQKKAA